ncbi:MULTISPECIES: class E sortase [unclassified Streptomyces]|uniref:class E sortase n=1 Tax=unclassified Streptomyces TaxID=2593676 RepID=UPI001906B04B|nr:class E sortase [Streptomyces sp. HSG2]
MRVVVRSIVELCVTVGVLAALFVVHALFWSGVRAAEAMQDQRDSLRDRWSRESEARSQVTPAPDTPFGIMHIPRLGFTWNMPVLEGTTPEILEKGLGHYVGTALPGRMGNFAVAGHRRTHGSPFRDFPELRPGDDVVLTDGTTWFTYRIDKGPYRTVPTDTEVVGPLPRASGYLRPGRYLTLTTCEPEWGHSHRLVVWASLRSSQPVEAGKPESLRR